MKVVVNAQLLHTGGSYRSAGVSSYARNLLTALAAQNGEHELTAFLNDRNFRCPQGHQGLHLRYTRWPAAAPLPRIIWEQTALPLAARAEKADLVHGLVNTLPLASNVPGVVTVHDLSFLRLPERFPRLKQLYLARLCRASVRKAQRVIAVSRQTAADVREHFGVDSRRVEVVYNGVGERFGPLPAQDVLDFRRRKGLPQKYLLYVGTLEPRKNLPHLLRAYADWQANSTTGRDVALVLAGAKGWHYREIFDLAAELGLTGPMESAPFEQGPMVQFPGFVPEEELCLWYNAAAAFVYPSLFEGFGLPLLEAMASGTPVICSDAPSLQEVAGDSALVVPVQDRPALQNAFERLFTEPGLAAELRSRGIRQAGRFSWQRAAAETIDVYESALHRSD